MEILIFIVFAALIIAGGIYQYYRNEQRKTELTALAARLGWQFRSDKDPYLAQRFGGFKCLQRGDNRYAYNVLNGAYQERPVCAFDYHFETYSTDSKGNRSTHHHCFSALLLDTGLPLKPLLIRPEGFFDKVGELFGLDDIDFESNQFSREFFVKADDRKWAFDVLHQATIEFLLAAPRFTLEIQGPWVIATRGATFSPAEFEEAAEVSWGLIDRLPNYLHREWKGAAR